MYHTSIFIIILVLFLTGCGPVLQDRDTFTGKEVAIKYELLNNFLENQKPRFRSALTLTNNGQDPLGDRGWSLFFNQRTRRIIAESIQGPVTIQQINGDFYRLSPTSLFNLESGQSMDIIFDCEWVFIKESDVPQGWYMVYYDKSGGEVAQVPVRDYEVVPFTRPQQINRTEMDLVPIPTGEWLFENNQNVSLLDEDELLSVIPSPVAISQQSGEVSISGSTIIEYEPGLITEANLLAERLSQVLTTSPTIKEGITDGSSGIQLKLGDIKVKGSSTEAYQLDVSGSQGIIITGSDGAGVFYGIQSLVARLPLEAWSKPKESISINAVKIVDAPAFTYRGMHLDVGRNFNNKETVLRLLDLMAFYKLNKFLFNLTEDEGWRLEIEELPELTQIGAFRGHTLDDSEHLIPAYGSGPDRKNEFGSGFFSREDFKEIIRYAYNRHIEVIPEYNLPGHSRAAIKAMEYRYRKYMAESNEEKALEYRLLDPDDQSEYSSAQHFTDNVVCVCRESVYRFYETVLDDIIEMYQEAEVPLKMIHTGGDEVPQGSWEGSPLCQEFLKENPQIDNPRNLQSYFFSRILPIIQERNLITGGWEEVAMTFMEDGEWEPNTQFAGPQVVPYVWNSLRGNEDLGYQLANAGYPTVLCNVTNFYFDLAYDKDPREPGLYWGGFVHTKKAYEFIPYDLFKSTKEDVLGELFDEATDFVGMERLKEELKPNILGLQGQLWSETIKGRDMLENYYLPKMLGLAERAWVGQADWGSIQDKETREIAIDRDWNIFANTVARREFVRLEYFNGGYNVHLPAPGASINQGKLAANSSYPGLAIRYTTDGSEPNVNSSLYIEPVEVPSGSVKLKVFNGQGRGGLTTILAAN